MKISSYSVLSYLISFVLLSQSVPVLADSLGHETKKSNQDYLPKPVFLNDETWTQAFIDMNQLMADQFALGKHKKIQWVQLENKYAPLIISAEKNKDKAAYYQAIRSYMLELNDAHSFSFADTDDKSTTQFISDLVKKHTSGTYGLIINKINDGRYIVSYIEPNSPASEAGIMLGAEILMWNDTPIAQAINDTNILWNDESELITPGASYAPSTLAGLEYEKTRMLTRNTLGGRADITWKNPGQDTLHKKALFAFDDQNFIAKKTALYKIDAVVRTTSLKEISNEAPDPSKEIIVKWLPGNYVQLKLGLNDGSYCDPYMDEKKSPLYAYFIKTMQEIISKKPKGIIIDLRGHPGGDGRLAMDYAGFFTASSQTLFSIKLTFYNTATKDYRPIPNVGPYYIHGQVPYYDGPTVVLTDIATISGGEWAALSFQRIGKPILSFYPNTQGAFAGSVGAPYIIMPENFVINFSDNIAFDETNQVLVESNGKLEGGVKTDVLIPLDAKSAIDINTHDKDAALNFAISYLKKIKHKAN